MRGTLFQIYRRKNWNRYSPVLDPVRPPFASLSLCPLFIGYLPAFDRLNGSIVNVKFLESIEEEEKRKKKDRNRITSWNVQTRRIYVYHFPEWRRIYWRSETRRKNDPSYRSHLAISAAELRARRVYIFGTEADDSSRSYRQRLFSLSLTLIPGGGEAKDLAIEFGCNRSWRHRVSLLG